MDLPLVAGFLILGYTAASVRKQKAWVQSQAVKEGRRLKEVRNDTDFSYHFLEFHFVL